MCYYRSHERWSQQVKAHYILSFAAWDEDIGDVVAALKAALSSSYYIAPYSVVHSYRNKSIIIHQRGDVDLSKYVIYENILSRVQAADIKWTSLSMRESKGENRKVLAVNAGNRIYMRPDSKLAAALLKPFRFNESAARSAHRFGHLMKKRKLPQGR